MSRPPEAPDDSRTQELVERLQSGQAGAWEELYREYRDELLFYVRARLGANLRALVQSEDILQSVALDAFRALPRFESRSKGSLRRFLHTLIQNKIRDRADTFGAAKRAGGVPLTDAVAAELAARGPEALDYRDPAYERLERALRALPDAMREVLTLRRIDGLSTAELAARLAKSEDAARKLYSRALAQLALHMGAQVER